MDIVEVIFSALIGALTVWLARDVIIPKVAGILSKSAKLHKKWNYSDSLDGVVVGRIETSQLGKKITIKAVRILGRDGEATNRKFTYKGTIVGRNLVLTFEQDGAGGTVNGALVLRLSANLKEMVGSTQYYSDKDGSVVNYSIFFNAAL